MPGGHHFYTTLISERDSAIKNYSWQPEATECWVFPARPEPGSPGGLLVALDGTVPLHRLYHPGNNDHFYTTLDSEVTAAKAAGYSYEFVECFVFPARSDQGGLLFPPSGTSPLYRLSHAVTGDHFYTVLDSEKVSAQSAFNYTFDVVECFVYPARSDSGGLLFAPASTVPLFRLVDPYVAPPPEEDDDGWFSKLVSSIGDTFTRAVEAVVDAANTVFGPVMSFINWLLTPIAWVVEAFSTLPLIGGLIRWSVSGVQTLVNFGLSLPDFVLSWIGIRPEKRLRLSVILQRDAQGVYPSASDANGNPIRDASGNPVTSESIARAAVQLAIDVYKREANVKIIPAGDDFIHVRDSTSSERTLDVCCDTCAAGKDLGYVGADFRAMMLAEGDASGSVERVFGYGNPITAFSVRSYTDGKSGCSLGPLTDYVTVKFVPGNAPPPTTLAHEIGHACGLNPNPFDTHSSDKSNLMWKDTQRGTSLDAFQVAFLRTSRHVTYF